MSGRPNKVRQIYAELRRSVGAVMPAIELLRLAAALVEASHSSIVDDEYSAYQPELANGQLPLDEAFADGGWRMMEREWRWVGRTYCDPVRRGLIRIDIGRASIGLARTDPLPWDCTRSSDFDLWCATTADLSARPISSGRDRWLPSDGPDRRDGSRFLLQD